MRILPNKEISKEEYIETYKRLKRENCGYEGGIIFNFRKGIVRKVFLNTFQLEKKVPKLKWLYQNEEELDNDIRVLSTVSYKGKFFSYDMTYDDSTTSLYCAPIIASRKTPYLKMTRNKLDHFHKLGMVYGDVKADNIIVNIKKGTCGFCDLDNTQIEDRYPMDVVSDYIELFTDENGFVGENADYYMHSLMTLQELDGEKKEYDKILKMLDEGYSFPFLEESATPTLEKINDAIWTYKGDYLIDYVKKR